ncbi:dihydrofolate reductase [Rhodococcus sp. D2-41]|uniref:Dihydrofolate reductase n=1 Tax=Speluncibacter jeojiensis TaxID=2710754 RepID=A0A9X4M1T5_9ACTN|nr:dihydrofolate reductase [Rhodococcus sp. D2-41]MDG3014832.1 dihydrofolate reductase [Corynebacteriales bacterium D3-21]
MGLVWAQARRGVIGRDNAIPWRLPEDMAHFKQTTTGHTVVMGRRTWDSLPPRFRPLPGRRNIVVTRQRDLVLDGAETTGSVADAVSLAGESRCWIIGGAQIYCAALELAGHCEVTEIDLDIEGDAYAPELGPQWTAAPSEWQSSETGLRYRFLSYQRVD